MNGLRGVLDAIVLFILFFFLMPLMHALEIVELLGQSRQEIK